MSDKASVVEFTVEGNPIPKQRAVTRFKDGEPVRTFTPHSTADWESRIAWAARAAMAGRDPLQGPLALEVWAFRSTRRRADFDNLAKAVTDAVQASKDCPEGIVFADDAQIIDAYIHKRVDPAYPRIVVRVCTTEEDPR